MKEKALKWKMIYPTSTKVNKVNFYELIKKMRKVKKTWARGNKYYINEAAK